MPQEFGQTLPVTIPELADVANIETAFKQFFYGDPAAGGVDGSTATQSQLYAATGSVGAYIQQLLTDKADADGATLTNTTLTSPTINTPVFADNAIAPSKITNGTEGYVLRAGASTPIWVDPTTVPVSEAAKVENAITFNSSGSGETSPQSFDGSAVKTVSYNTIGAAALSHAHGSITSAGAIGSTAGLIVKTGTSGVLGALAAGTSGQFLRHDATWSALPTASSSQLGVVQTDGATINIASGVISANATSSNTASALVARDASGNFSAGTMTGNVIGKVTVDSTNASVGKIYVQAVAPTSPAAGDIWMW